MPSKESDDGYFVKRVSSSAKDNSFSLHVSHAIDNDHCVDNINSVLSECMSVYL